MGHAGMGYHKQPCHVIGQMRELVPGLTGILTLPRQEEESLFLLYGRSVEIPSCEQWSQSLEPVGRSWGEFLSRPLFALVLAMLRLPLGALGSKTANGGRGSRPGQSDESRRSLPQALRFQSPLGRVPSQPRAGQDSTLQQPGRTPGAGAPHQAALGTCWAVLHLSLPVPLGPAGTPAVLASCQHFDSALLSSHSSSQPFLPPPGADLQQQHRWKVQPRVSMGQIPKLTLLQPAGRQGRRDSD